MIVLCLIQPVMLSTLVCKVSSHIWVSHHHLREISQEFVIPHQMFRPQFGQCCQEYVWWSIQRTSAREFTVLHRLPKIVLDYPSECCRWLADHNVTKSDIILSAGHPASNT